MAKRINFKDTLYLQGKNVEIHGTGGLRVPVGDDNSAPDNMLGIIRYNYEKDQIEIGTEDDVLVFNTRGEGTIFYPKTGGELDGDLIIRDYKILNNGGSSTNPTYSFYQEEDTGFYRDGNANVSLVLNSLNNDTPIFSATRLGSNDFEQEFILNTDVHIKGSETEVDGNLLIHGNLIVEGSETIVNTESLTVEDDVITLNKNGQGIGFSGIEIEADGSIEARFEYNFSTGRWDTFGKNISVNQIPSQNHDLTNKEYVDTEIQVINDNFTNEINRIDGELGDLDQKIDDETNRAIGEEQRIENKFDNEVNRIDGELGDLNQDIINETNRAIGEEQRIENKFDNEVNRIDGELGDLDQKIDDETNRAIGEEQRIENKFDNEVSDLNDRVDQKIHIDEKAQPNGVATLNSSGIVPNNQLPNLDSSDVDGAVDESRTISTTNGIIGGGDLSSDRVFELDNTVIRTSGNQTINGDLNINGEVNISGNTIQVDSQIVTANRIITINDGETGSGVTNDFAGIVIDRGNLPNYEFGFSESTGLLELGEVGDRQPVATREQNPSNNGYARWNASERRFEAILPSNSTTSTSQVNVASSLAVKTVQDAVDDLDNNKVDQNTAVNLGTGLNGSSDLSGSLNINLDNPFNPSGDYSNLRARSTTKADVGLAGIPDINGNSNQFLRGDGVWAEPVDTTYDAGTGLTLVGNTFNVDNPFNPSGDYNNLRARGTTASDVGLNNVVNIDTTNADNITSGTLDTNRLPQNITTTVLDNINFSSGIGIVEISSTPISYEVFLENPFDPSGDYNNLRARGTTASDVGLNNVVNTDTTNADNISSGTLSSSRLPQDTADIVFQQVDDDDGINIMVISTTPSTYLISVDNTVVRTSNNQTISGNKTFNDPIIISGSNCELRQADNATTGASIRAISNPSPQQSIFTVESTGASTRFGVTQEAGVFAKDGFWVGTYDNGERVGGNEVHHDGNTDRFDSDNYYDKDDIDTMVGDIEAALAAINGETP